MMKSFIGGVHPDDGKAYAKDKAIETPALPEQVVIPMSRTSVLLVRLLLK